VEMKKEEFGEGPLEYLFSFSVALIVPLTL
jgi:hypothetical protein